MTEITLSSGAVFNVTPVSSSQVKLDYLALHGITTLVTYGPDGSKGIVFSVDVITPWAQSFETPLVANSYQHAVSIALLECVRRNFVEPIKGYTCEVTK